MLNKKDQALENMLMALLEASDETAFSSAAKIRMEDTLYLVTRACILSRPAKGEEKNLPAYVSLPVNDDPGLNILAVKNPEIFKTEKLLIPQYLDMSIAPELMSLNNVILPVKHTELNKPGLWVLGLSGGSSNATYLKSMDASELMLSVPMRPYNIPAWMLECLKEVDNPLVTYRAQFSRTVTGDTPVMLLTGEESTLVVTLSARKDKSSLKTITMPDGAKLIPDAWQDDTQSWKELIRKPGDKMRTLGNPLRRTVKQEPPKPEPVKEEPEKETPKQEQETKTMEQIKVEDAAKAFANINSVNAAELASEEPKPVQEEQTAAPDQEATPKRKRQKPHPTDVVDLKSITDKLNAPVPEMSLDDIDKAIEDIRQLRDLSMVISRRMANISIEMHKATQSSLTTLNAVQKLLGR